MVLKHFLKNVLNRQIRSNLCLSLSYIASLCLNLTYFVLLCFTLTFFPTLLYFSIARTRIQEVHLVQNNLKYKFTVFSILETLLLPSLSKPQNQQKCCNFVQSIAISCTYLQYCATTCNLVELLAILCN